MGKLKTIIEYLFYLFIFLLPWQARLIFDSTMLNNGFWEYGTRSLYVTEILLGVIFLLVIVLAARQLRHVGAQPKILKIDILLISFIVFTGLSIVWSINVYLSWQIFLLFIEALALLYLTSRIGRNFTRLASVFVLSAVVQSCLAIYQFSSQLVWSNKWLGMSGQLVGDGGTSVVEGAGRWLRAYGSLPHPNMLGGFLVIGLLFLLGLLFNYQKQYYKLPWKMSAKFLFNAICLFTSLVVITYGLLLTFSRSAWLGLIIAMLFIWVILFIRKRKKLLLFFFKINIAILLVVALFVINYGDLLFNRFNTTSRLEVQSISERQVGWREAGEIIQASPLLGVGLGTYTQALYELDASRPSYAYQPVHNINLLILAELGIVGWLIFVITIIYLLYLAFKKLREQKEDYNLVVFVGMFLVLLVIGLFDHYLWSLYFGLMLSCLLAGLLIRRVE
jgi:O-antigen ligase